MHRPVPPHDTATWQASPLPGGYRPPLEPQRGRPDGQAEMATARKPPLRKRAIQPDTGEGMLSPGNPGQGVPGRQD